MSNLDDIAMREFRARNRLEARGERDELVRNPQLPTARDLATAAERRTPPRSAEERRGVALPADSLRRPPRASASGSSSPPSGGSSSPSASAPRTPRLTAPQSPKKRG